LIDLGAGKRRLGGSVLAQVYNQIGDVPPDLDNVAMLKTAFLELRALAREGLICAYHDRSDGGLWVSLAEMAFAGHCGVDIELPDTAQPLAELFSEELGMVLQVPATAAAAIFARLNGAGLQVLDVGTPNTDDTLRIKQAGESLYARPRAELYQCWSETSHRIAALRDDPDCAREEFESAGSAADPGLSVQLSFTPAPAAPVIGKRPRVAILREQGVNGQAEMAYAFHLAGFESVDVHMSDILEGRVTLDSFAGLAACGGFSYGDVLGAGQGWAKSILFHARAREQFATFLADPERFALGVCNGCQMFAALKSLVPGAEHWPAFRRNRSEQFEARWTLVELTESRSIFFTGMAGSKLPIAVAHGEGRAVFASEADRLGLIQNQQIAMRFIDNHGAIATRYPQNPNGSPDGITSVCNTDGRITILMPHPERTIAGVTGSWWPQTWDAQTPWFQMFQNARRFVKGGG